MRGAEAVGDVAVDDRHAPVAAEGAGRDLHTWRILPALVFAPVDERDDARHDIRPVASRDELLGPEVLLDVTPQDGVELVIGRQTVRVLLVGLELGGRGLVMTRSGMTRLIAFR